jgi:micrococcal nuclease
MPLILLVVLLSLVVAAPTVDAAPQAEVSATCDDYSNQRDAQENKDTRDADGDGIYCEALPCPCLKPGGEPSPPRPSPPKKKKKPRKRSQVISARITSIVDGDTIRVRAFSAKRDYYAVRLIGIDTPETKKPGTPVECGGKEATENMLALSFSDPVDTDGDDLLDEAGGKGRRVTLRTDPSQDTFDRYDRLLAYVTTTGGVHLQVAQLSDGWAKVYVFEKRFRQYSRFRRAQLGAKGARRGVWGDCGGNFHRASR